MTTNERVKRMYEHREADRIPVMDSPWGSTVERWEREGLPKGVDYRDYFGLDKTAQIDCDNSPRFDWVVHEENDDYVIMTTNWGATIKNFKHHGGVPQFLDFKVKDFESWLEAKKRMEFDESRIPWDMLKREYPKWKAEGRWITAGLWFGFDVTHSWFIGTERFLMAMLEEPEWCLDMYDTFLSLNLKMLDRLWEEGYRFDEITWPNDMGYKGRTFFSLETYRGMDKPFQKKAVDWAHEHGVYARMHSCGDIMTFVPDLVEIGMDGLNPLEVKAGMQPLELKRAYGDRLLLHGGINAVLWDKPEEITEEIRRVVPVLKENGGYIFASDHSIPESVSLENFRLILDTVKEAGKY